MQLLRRNSACCACRCSRNTLRLFIRAVVLIVSIIASGMHHRPVFGLTSEERSELARKFKYYHRTVRPALELNMLDTLNGTFFRLVTELELQDTFQAPESEAHRLSVDFALFVHYRDDRLLLRDLPGSMAIPDEFQPWTPRIQPMPMELAHGLLVQKSSTFEPKMGHLTAIFRFYGTIRCEFDAWKVPFERYKCLFWLETDPEERLALRTLRDLRPNWQMRRVKITIDHWPFLTLSLTFQSHRWHHTLVSAYVPSFLLFSCALVAQWRRRKIQVIVTMGALLAILILFHQHSQIVLPLKSSTTLLDLWLGVVFVHLVCLLSADLLLPARQTVVFKKASRRGLYSSSYSSPPIQNGRTLTSSQPLYSTPHYVSSTHLQPLSHGTAHPTSRLSRHITPSPGQLIRTLSVPPPLRRLAAQVTRRAELPPPAHSEPLQRRQTTTALSRAADSGEQRAQRIATLLAEMESIRREAEDIGPPLRHADSVVAVDELIAAAAASSEAVLFKTFARLPPAEPPKTTTPTALNTWAMKRFPSATNFSGAGVRDSTSGTELGRTEGIPRRKRFVLGFVAFSFAFFMTSYATFVALLTLDLIDIKSYL
uniref:Neur_chan_LBD domain-containing protein n=1 Tax=Globodera pallida TaxID=36090 RepID=A0A183CAC1_GLOPA